MPPLHRQLPAAGHDVSLLRALESWSLLHYYSSTLFERNSSFSRTQSQFPKSSHGGCASPVWRGCLWADSAPKSKPAAAAGMLLLDAQPATQRRPPGRDAEGPSCCPLPTSQPNSSSHSGGQRTAACLDAPGMLTVLHPCSAPAKRVLDPSSAYWANTEAMEGCTCGLRTYHLLAWWWWGSARHAALGLLT